MKPIILLIVTLLSVALGLNLVSNTLGSHMVLQRAPQRANLWGFTSAGVRVEVTFNSATYSAISNAKGEWNVFLPPTPAGGPYTIRVLSDAGESVFLEDILFGDVYICSGQSNMQFTVREAFNSTAEIAAAANYNQIRVFTVGQRTTSLTPEPELGFIEQAWAVASPTSIGGPDWDYFSATCWFFGRDLFDAIHVPLGLISTNWGGTYVQAWSSPDALAKCTNAEESVSSVEAPGPNTPSVLWNAMIVPYLPMSITGATWYQGEANAGQADYYACAFPAMIADWRLKWGGDTPRDFGFYFVQLAPWIINGSQSIEATIRLAQLYALKLPKVGVAISMDNGDPTSPYNNIHPRYKQVVGYRLSLPARAITYNQKIQYEGPYATNFIIVSDGPNAVVAVNFEPSSIGSGLILTDAHCASDLTPDQCAGFEIGSSENSWHAATVSLDRDRILVRATITGRVYGVRYGWANYPIATLYNKEGLPAVPFAFPNPVVPVK
eukprot:TRINITY_DN947_c0_g1_i5.p1 TRINITY_DN947_c0_g1~~TRINITY_DN947_c0_g1_i5.p1  ORF type:complete len:494 (+),score=91.72 TRINITY_DN947_c0_g1_i5:100-1581(+)